MTATDTDVLVLLTHAYPQCNIAKQWLMKTNPGMLKQLVTSLEMAFVKFYQDTVVVI